MIMSLNTGEMEGTLVNRVFEDPEYGGCLAVKHRVFIPSLLSKPHIPFCPGLSVANV